MNLGTTRLKGLKNTIIHKVLTYASEIWTLTERDRKQLNVFERKVYRRILGPVHDNEAYKTKNSRKILPRGHYTIQQNTVAKH